MEKKIKFKDMNWNCKVGIIGGWILLIYFILAFSIGIMLGIASLFI